MKIPCVPCYRCVKFWIIFDQRTTRAHVVGRKVPLEPNVYQPIDLRVTSMKVICTLRRGFGPERIHVPSYFFGGSPMVLIKAENLLFFPPEHERGL